VPPMAADRHAALKTDIHRCGAIRMPVVFWRDPESGERLLIDGRSRLSAGESLGMLSFVDRVLQVHDFRAAAKNKIITVPEIELEGDPFEIVASLNLHRRDLTRNDRKKLAEALLKANPERSNAATSKLAGLSDKTVADVRHDLEATSEIPRLQKTVGADGKARSKPQRRSGSVAAAVTVETAPVETAPVETGVEADRVEADRVEAATPGAAKPGSRRKRGGRQPAQSLRPQRLRPAPSLTRDTAITQFVLVLHAKPRETLDDLTRLLRDEQAHIVSNVSAVQRVAAARGYLAAIGVMLADLTGAVQPPAPLAAASAGSV
jgi:hypothetical protein